MIPIANIPQHKPAQRSKLIRLRYILPILIFTTFGPLSWALSDSTLIIKWLSPGMLPVMPPAFASQPNVKGKAFQDSELFETVKLPANSTATSAGKKMEWPGTASVNWQEVKAGRDGFVEIKTQNVQKSSHALGMAMVNLHATRFTKVQLNVYSTHMVQLLLDGAEQTKSYTRKGKEPYTMQHILTLEPGYHKLIIRSIYTRAISPGEPWRFKASVKSATTGMDHLQFTTEPLITKDIRLLLEGLRIQATRPSFQGDYYFLDFEEVQPNTGKSETWTELWQRHPNRLLRSFRASEMRQFIWSPVNNQFIFTLRDKENTQVWLGEVSDAQTRMLFTDKEIGNLRWSPDGNTVFFSKSEQPDPVTAGIHRIENMPARWPWSKRKAFLNAYHLPSQVQTRLTWGKESVQLLDIHPDGKSLLISTSIPDFSERPFSIQTLMSLDLQTLGTDTLLRTSFDVQAIYNPDGTKLLLTGSAMLFDGMGSSLPPGSIPNDYDKQLYLFDPLTKQARPLSLSFDPSIDQALWHKDDKFIYLLTTDQTYKRIYRYDANNETFTRLDLPVDVISQWQLSSAGSWLGITGSSISSPPISVLYHTQTGEKFVISDPEADVFSNVRMGGNFDWNYQMPGGPLIQGRVYLPPDFDPAKRYPVIVHYYGGTTPVDRSFRGRYPKNLFAAHGYIIYVMQPSGAIGYGQEFSASHVNNWGQTVADEIISSTKQFLREHPYADSTRVGCIGASYGGFMTMLLLTKTQMFATGIAHAGISSISSYWGEGFWGYLYSAAASANSYPWNNESLYVGQSPLFQADKIKTPLLLLHGRDDDNVPPGESIQLFTALKILGTPVELIEIEGQGHHVMDYNKRIKWQKTILAWFAKYLQDDPSWWKELYPDA